MLNQLKYEMKNLGLKTVIAHILAKLKLLDEEDYIICRQNVFSKMSVEQLKPHLSRMFEKELGYKPDFDNPKTFAEKLQWLKLYDSTAEKTRLADKYLVREYIKETIGEEYLIPLLGAWDNFDEIDFEKLPSQFVLKTNHGSQTNLIVKDKSKLNKKAAKKKFDKWMKVDYAYKAGFELHYHDIPRKIIAEEFIQQIDGDLFDYKLMCTDGEVQFIWVDTGRYTDHRRNLYTKDWTPMKDCTIQYPRSETEVPKPENLAKMVELSEKLSKGFANVRVDFYDVDGKLLFGELTFTSGDGFETVKPDSFALSLGGKIKLPKSE